MTLREGDREYFYAALDRHFPGLKVKYQRKYGNKYGVHSDNNDRLMKIFYKKCRQYNIVCNNDEIFTFLRTFPNTSDQLNLL
jgi:hypothetical protein